MGSSRDLVRWLMCCSALHEIQLVKAKKTISKQFRISIIILFLLIDYWSLIEMSYHPKKCTHTVCVHSSLKEIILRLLCNETFGLISPGIQNWYSLMIFQYSILFHAQLAFLQNSIKRCSSREGTTNIIINPSFEKKLNPSTNQHVV